MAKTMKIGPKSVTKKNTDMQAHTVTFIAVSDILPTGYSAKTDLFAFKTHSAPVIITIVTRELKP